MKTLEMFQNAYPWNGWFCDVFEPWISCAALPKFGANLPYPHKSGLFLADLANIYPLFLHLIDFPKSCQQWWERCRCRQIQTSPLSCSSTSLPSKAPHSALFQSMYSTEFHCSTPLRVSQGYQIQFTRRFLKNISCMHQIWPHSDQQDVVWLSKKPQ